MNKTTIFFLTAVVLGLFLWEFIYVDRECTPTISPLQDLNNTCLHYCELVNPPCVCPTSPPYTPCPTISPCPTPSLCPNPSQCPTPSPCPTCPPPSPSTCAPDPEKTDNPVEALSVKRSLPRIIIDAFTFGHELDWLEIRMNELSDVVDYFIIMEGQLTFAGKYKPMFYLDNKDKYANLVDKILHVNCTPPNASQYFEIEVLSRKCLTVGVELAVQKLKEKNIMYSNSDLIIMTSDLDEIPRPNMVKKWKWFDSMPSLPGRIDYRFFYYSYHWQLNVRWMGTIVLNYQLMLDNPASIWRGPAAPNPPLRTIFREGGWHCSSCLTPENLRYKIKTFSHTELDTPQITDLVHLNDSIENGKDWAFRNIYNFQPTEYLGDLPKYLLQNMDKFANLVPLNKYEKVKVLEASLKYHDGAELWSHTPA